MAVYTFPVVIPDTHPDPKPGSQPSGGFHNHVSASRPNGPDPAAGETALPIFLKVTAAALEVLGTLENPRKPFAAAMNSHKPPAIAESTVESPTQWRGLAVAKYSPAQSSPVSRPSIGTRATTQQALDADRRRCASWLAHHAQAKEGEICNVLVRLTAQSPCTQNLRTTAAAKFVIDVACMHVRANPDGRLACAPSLCVTPRSRAPPRVRDRKTSWMPRWALLGVAG